MEFSCFADKAGAVSAIGRLMDDLAAGLRPGVRVSMLGGGNPAAIPEANRVFRRAMRRLLRDPAAFDRALGVYDPPQGNEAFIEALVERLQRDLGWPVTPRHVALTLGSQTALFLLLNMLSGRFPDGSRRRILFPLTPEYIGYADAALEPGCWCARRPRIERLDPPFFKYRIDFDRLGLDEGFGAVCVSRPTNPTANVLTDAEIERLWKLCRAQDIPLIIDSAYGEPFPGIVFAEAAPFWREGVIACLSLSKLGLPGLRTGVVVADPEVIERLGRMTAIVSLAPVRLGAALAADLVASGEMSRLCADVIRPFYQKRAEEAVAAATEAFDGLDVRLHAVEGAFFLWIWFRDPARSSLRLYRRLKERGIIVVPGRPFAFGLDRPWTHADRCVRINIGQDPAEVRRALAVLAEECRAPGA